MLNNKQAKKRILTVLFGVIAIFFVIIIFRYAKRKMYYDTVVAECDNDELVSKWNERGEAYAIGSNYKGLPIFKDKNKAYKQAIKDYSLGFEYLMQYEHLPKLSASAKVCEKYREAIIRQVEPPMTVDNYEEIGKQNIMIIGFLDIYLNSYGL